MKPNDFDTNISYKHSKTFSTRMRILLFLALLMTGLISTAGIIQIAVCLKEHIWQSTDALPFAWNSLFFLCIFCCFVSLVKIALSDQPFSKSLVLCIQMIGWLFLTSSVLFPRLPGYHSSGFDIFSYGSFFLIDGTNLTLGILIIIFGCLIHEGLRMQKDLDEVL